MIKKNSGVEFEKEVAAIQQLFDKNASVEHNQLLVDRFGQRRQFDVVIKGKFAGIDCLCVIECKNTKSLVGNPEIEAFITKSRDINANLKIIVSKNGFTKPSLIKAKDYGIQTYSLLANDRVRVFLKFLYCIFAWSKTCKLQFEPLDGSTQCHLNISDVKYKGVSVLNWFVYYLITRCPEEKRLGTYVLKIKFFKEQTFTTDTNKKLKTSVIEYTITRELFFKEKYIEVTEGDGYFDWQKEQPKYPQGGNIKVEVINPDIVLSEEPEINFNQLVTEKYNFFLHCFLDGLPNINKLPKLDSLASIDFSFSPNLQMQQKDLSRLLIG